MHNPAVRESDRSIGIDLGTTYSCAAIVEGGRPQVIRSRLGYSTIPSVVTFDDQGQPVVGQDAERRTILQPEETIYGSKRLIGRTYLPGVVERFQPHFQYKLGPDQDGFVAACVGGRTVPLVEVSSYILRELRIASQRSLGEKVHRAVVTVPAYFNENQRGFVREAGRRAGLEIIRIINEPTAAALCFGFNRAEHKRLLVFDLGGGTFDVSIVDLDGNTFTVVATHGDTFLGGLDFDRRIAEFLQQRAEERLDREIILSPSDRQRLRLAAQDAKHQLSELPRAAVQIPMMKLADGTKIDLTDTIDRHDLDEITGDLVDRTVAVVNETLAMASLQAKEIDEVLLVGGQTRMPAVQKRLREMFGREPTKRIHPDEVVALGAAIAADAHDRDDTATLRDVLPLSIGIGGADGSFIPVIPRNTPVPHEGVATLEIPAGSQVMKIGVFQGEKKTAKANEFLGALGLEGLAVAEQPVSCELVFSLDAECLLRVRASVEATGFEREVTLGTQQTPDQVLEQLGKVRISVPTAAPPDVATAAAGPRGPAPQIEKKGFWQRLKGWLFEDG